ncbi:MAG TPA: dodecin family protein [Miltoncostaeales bacterium]|jgi:flavin-binding protein dodecin|nr:dodecin family protein [Miltoncostaeales bacterium]
MSVAKVEEISAVSTTSFDDAIKLGIARATKTLRGVKGAWIKEQYIRIDDSGKITEYQVNMKVTFVLED